MWKSNCSMRTEYVRFLNQATGTQGPALKSVQIWSRALWDTCVAVLPLSAAAHCFPPWACAPVVPQTARHSMFRLKLSIPEVCLKIILIIFFAFSVKMVWPQWRMKLLLYPCKKIFCFPTVNHRCEFLTPEEPFLVQMCLLLSLKKNHPDVKASKSSSRDLPGLCSSQVLGWFQSVLEWSRTWVQVTHGCRSSLWGWEHRVCLSSPSGHRGVASRDKNLLDLPVGGEGDEYWWKRARPGRGGWHHLWRSELEMGQEKESWGS